MNYKRYMTDKELIAFIDSVERLQALGYKVSADVFKDGVALYQEDASGTYVANQRMSSSRSTLRLYSRYKGHCSVLTLYPEGEEENAAGKRKCDIYTINDANPYYVSISHIENGKEPETVIKHGDEVEEIK